MKKKTVSNKLINFFRNHSRDLCFAMGQIRKAPLGNLLTVLAIAIALALPFGLYILVSNIQHVGGQPTPYLSIYLKKQNQFNQLKLQNKLESMRLVQEVRYISPEEGIKEFPQYIKLNRFDKSRQANPLPGVFVVKLNNHNNIAAIEMLASQLKQNPQIQLVQINMTWVKRLHYIINFGQRLTLALAIVFSLAVILIITNTIRLITQRNKKDIQIMRLFGATRHFIRRPLLYRGTLLGFTGGLLAWILVCLILHWMVIPLKMLALSYQSPLKDMGIRYNNGLILTLVSTILAFIGSWIAISPYLHAQEE